MSHRKSGFYWVRFIDETDWTIGRWGDDGYWTFYGNEREYSEKDAEIAEVEYPAVTLPPQPPKAGQRWLDISQDPPIDKIWTGTEWAIVTTIGPSPSTPPVDPT